MRAGVIDFQGYLTPQNCYIAKEVTIIDVDYPSVFWHWLFKPPSQEDIQNLSTNKWVFHNLHGINWYDGDVEYSELKSLCQKSENFTILFAKGLEKSVFLEKLIGKEVFDLQDFGCPSLKCLTSTMEFIKCIYYCGKKSNCSLKFAKILVDWISNNRSKVDLYDARIREKTFNHWTGSVNASLLLFNGFFYTRKHTLKCIYFGLELLDNIHFCPCAVHKLNNPKCIWFVKNGLIE